MALTKRTEIEQLEIIGPYKIIGVQERTVVKEDDKELLSSRHRKLLMCGRLDETDNLVETDVSSESTDVQNLCNTFWTTDIKNAYKAHLLKARTTT
tara:strand:+ start:204 stop:491 length:288 start_codon:yes stop_codon:yes gene_type:complete